MQAPADPLRWGQGVVAASWTGVTVVQAPGTSTPFQAHSPDKKLLFQESVFAVESGPRAQVSLRRSRICK